MILTTSQRQAVADKGHVYLTACPGSGKTRVIVAKLLQLLEESAGTSHRIACLTYTNAAVYEIESRLSSLAAGLPSHRVDVGTIHSFCLNNVLRHYYWRVSEYREGFKVADPDSDVYLEVAESIRVRYGLTADVRSSFSLLDRRVDGSPISADLPPNAALDFWKELGSRGFIDFVNIVYHSYAILREFPSAAQGLAARFAWFLVDESQDTSELQVRILDQIRKAGAEGRPRFFMVGDPMQSIFGFAGARPELMDSFAETLDANTDIELLDNFRSSAPILRQADRLLPRGESMVAAGESVDFGEEPRYVHADTPTDAVVNPNHSRVRTW